MIKCDLYKHFDNEAPVGFPLPSFAEIVAILLRQNYGLHRLLSNIVHHLERPGAKDAHVELAHFIRKWLDDGNY